MNKPADHDKRMDAARARATWEIGDPSWADLLINAYFNPEDDQARLSRDKAS